MQWDLHCAEQRTWVHSRDQRESRHVESFGKQRVYKCVSNAGAQSQLLQHRVLTGWSYALWVALVQSAFSVTIHSFDTVFLGNDLSWLFLFCLLIVLNLGFCFCFCFFHLTLQVLLSGGVDSTVCTALLNRALNQDQVIAVHIDNGFMRKRESQSVEEALKKLGIQVKGIDEPQKS